MKSICAGCANHNPDKDEYNDTVDKVILVQRIAQSPKAIIALLAENRRLARRVAKLERMIADIPYFAPEGPPGCDSRQPRMQRLYVEAARIARRKQGAR